jgi:hypothetical protein
MNMAAASPARPRIVKAMVIVISVACPPDIPNAFSTAVPQFDQFACLDT